MKKLLVLMMSIIMVLGMASCGSEANGTGGTPTSNDAGITDGGNPAEGEITVEIEIDYPDGSGVKDVEDKRFEVPAGSSALDVLMLYAKANNFDIIMDESSATAYVTSVNGVDSTSTAGWIYELNEQSIMEQASDVIVAQGDEISWSFEEWDDMD